MNEDPAFERCLTYIDCELKSPPPSTPWVYPLPAGPAVTISRQAGTGAHRVAEELAALMQSRAPRDGRPWTVFDQNLVERILEDHHLPDRLASFMPEDRVSAISDMVEELCGVHPSRWNLVHQAAATILRLADVGNVILVGRGASAVTAGVPHVYHVRLFGSFEVRAKRLQRMKQLSEAEARATAEKTDRARRRFLKRYFKRDIEDPLMYELMLNTDHLSASDAAQLIAEGLMRFIEARSAAARQPASMPPEDPFPGGSGPHSRREPGVTTVRRSCP